MAELYLLAGDADINRHVVFIHGLRRARQKVWMSGEPPELWPLWLSADIDRLGIWSLEYDSAPTMWRGHSMARVDRANNVLSRILLESRLQKGDISFVTHSFGGLVFEQMIRLANDRSMREPAVAALLERISRVTFLGTPHRGADLATWGGWIGLVSRLSSAAQGLERNDPDLRDLNQFYRGYALQHQIDTQSLVETRRVPWLGLIVKPDSADVGLPSTPIPVDADHFTIACPTSKTSDVYVHILHQLKKQLPSRQLVITDVDVIRSIAKDASENSTALARIEAKLSLNREESSIVAVPTALLDAETSKRLGVMRRMRFFAHSPHLEYAAQFARELIGGQLAATSIDLRADALAWCARLLLAKPDRAEGHQILEAARQIKRTEAVSIAEALADSYNNDISPALQKLSQIDSNDARAASLIVVLHANDRDALGWFREAGLTTKDISADGKLFLLKKQLDSAMWAEALVIANGLLDTDLEETPALAYVAAEAHLIQAVPEELRAIIRFQLTFDAATIPLADDAASIGERRKARLLYNRAAEYASSLGIFRVCLEARDRTLWLDLRDPSTRVAALSELQQSMRDPAHSLRRLPLALQFGLKLDLQAVESEIDRQNALSDGNSPDVALARLGLALAKNSPKDAAAYIAKHRAQLLKHLNPIYVSSVEVQVLVQSGQADLAEERINELPNDSDVEDEKARLRRIVAEGRGADPIESREVEFKRSNSLSDLVNLVHRLEERRDWPRLVKYGRELFSRTRDLSACKVFGRALFETSEYEGVISLLNNNPDHFLQSEYLSAIQAWSLYRMGRVSACREVLTKLRAARDDANDRVLLVNLAISSGDWASLGSFVEQEWERRSSRSARELLRAGQLARQLGSTRARELIEEAANRAGGDPAILIGCYGSAVAAGWENEETVRWLESAAALSDENGPVQQMSLKAISERQPEWQRREARTWEQLRLGNLPLFGTAHLLNRTLVELFLLPAIANAETSDPRRRSPVYAYSGNRLFFNSTAKSAAFDPTVFLTLGVIGFIQEALAFFEKIVIPHGTLGWLFEEKQRIQFQQPSRVVEAREIKQLIETKKLIRFERAAPVNLELAAEIGDDLAALFAEAQVSALDRGQRLVVRSSPVHRVGSLMEEEANLGEHSKYVCSCSDVITALARLGQLTQAEERHARSYLKIREKPWPDPVSIHVGASLYLDELSVTYLQHLRVLGKLQDAGLVGYVPPGEISQGDGFIRYEDLANRAITILDEIRNAIFQGIQSGKVILAPSMIDDDGEANPLHTHPTLEMMRTSAEADVFVIDDRHFNQHGVITGEFGSRQVWTTYDVLTFSLGQPDQLWERLTTLRRAGLCFIPLRRDELLSLVGSALVSGGKLIETAELKAVRESILVARLSDGLQWPKERVWLDAMTFAFMEAIKAQWVDGVDEIAASSKSSWLFEQLDIRQWASRYETLEDAGVSGKRYAGQVLSLAMLNADVKAETRKMYWRWFDKTILTRIREEQRELFNDIVTQVRSVILDTASKEGSEAIGE